MTALVGLVILGLVVPGRPADVPDQDMATTGPSAIATTTMPALGEPPSTVPTTTAPKGKVTLDEPTDPAGRPRPSTPTAPSPTPSPTGSEAPNSRSWSPWVLVGVGLVIGGEVAFLVGVAVIATARRRPRATT